MFCQNSSLWPVQSWVALLGMAHRLIEVYKPLHHSRLWSMKRGIQFTQTLIYLEYEAERMMNYWVGQKVHSGLLVKSYRQSWMNFLAKPVRTGFWFVMLEKTLESPLDCKEIKPVNPKGNQPWTFIGRTDAVAEAPVLWPPDEKNLLTGKDPDAGKDWRHKKKGDSRGWDG